MPMLCKALVRFHSADFWHLKEDCGEGNVQVRESVNARFCWTRALENSSPLCITSCRLVNSYRSSVGVYSLPSEGHAVQEENWKLRQHSSARRFSSLATETLYRSFVGFWPVKFWSGGLGASLIQRQHQQKGVSNKTKSCSYHHMCTVGRSANTGRFFIGQKQSNDL